jgi:hypothetical protein
MDLSPGQQKAVFAVIVIALAALGYYLVVPAPPRRPTRPPPPPHGNPVAAAPRADRDDVAGRGHHIVSCKDMDPLGFNRPWAHAGVNLQAAAQSQG